jgi:hypothetical protein
MSCALIGAATPAIAWSSGCSQSESLAGPGAVKPPVQVVGVDLPPTPDDPPRRKIEPGGATADLHLLAIWQPVAPLEAGVFQDDADVLELPVQISLGREAEAEADQLGAGLVDEERADDERLIE